MALQGFVIRGGVDQPDQGALDYTLRSQLFKSIGGAQFLSTFFEVPSPTNLQPSTYSVSHSLCRAFQQVAHHKLPALLQAVCALKERRAQHTAMTAVELFRDSNFGEGCPMLL